MLYKQFGEEKKGLKLRHKKKRQDIRPVLYSKSILTEQNDQWEIKANPSWYDPSEDNSHP